MREISNVVELQVPVDTYLLLQAMVMWVWGKFMTSLIRFIIRALQVTPC